MATNPKSFSKVCINKLYCPQDSHIDKISMPGLGCSIYTVVVRRDAAKENTSLHFGNNLIRRREREREPPLPDFLCPCS